MLSFYDFLKTRSNDFFESEVDWKQRIQSIGSHYDANSEYPNSRTKLGQHLSTLKRFYKSGKKWSPDYEQAAKDHGLPDDWMMDSNKIINDRNIELLGRYYTGSKILGSSQNKGTKGEKKRSFWPVSPHPLGIFLRNKRKAYYDFLHGTKNTNQKWYGQDDIDNGEKAGLPDNWMISKVLKYTVEPDDHDMMTSDDHGGWEQMESKEKKSTSDW